MKELKLIPPNDPRVNNAIAPFVDDMLKDEDIKDRQELSDAMFEAMTKYGGIGLSANQVGLPFNMFVIGGHPSIEKGLKMTCFNPMIVSAGEETIMMKEGCLTYPFIFLDIERPRKTRVATPTDKLTNVFTLCSSIHAKNPVDPTAPLIIPSMI